MDRRKQLDALCLEMIAHDKGDAHQIQHFLKVSALCALIARQEGLSEEECFLAEAAGYVHDCGIRVAMERFGKETWALQEELGPEAARPMLERNGFSKEETDRICFLVGHHHTYTEIQGMDYQILVEADFLVNLQEKKLGPSAIQKVYNDYFRTETGRRLAREMFDFA